jgi:hypothetical protein
MTVQPVDAVVTGVRVAGDKIVPDLRNVQPTDMTDEEREEFQVMSRHMSVDGYATGLEHRAWQTVRHRILS